MAISKQFYYSPSVPARTEVQQQVPAAVEKRQYHTYWRHIHWAHIDSVCHSLDLKCFLVIHVLKLGLPIIVLLGGRTQ